MRLKHTFLSIRYRIRPDVRAGLDGFATVFAITLFFCLLNSAVDGIVNRNRQFDKGRWWYPLYQLIAASHSNEAN